MSTVFSFCQLPSEVLATVLGGFSTGKTISTFLMVARGNVTLRQAAFSLCRGALVQRYTELSFRLRMDDEIRDVLDIVREDIRMSEDDDDDDAIYIKFAEWCAILDYFETQLAAVAVTTAFSPLRRSGRPHWIVWSGRLEIPYGEIQAYLTTPDWTVGAMHYWRNAELASRLTVTHPRNVNFHFTPEWIPYGTLFGMHEIDRRRLSIQCSNIEVSVLSESVEARRHALIPLHEAYEQYPSLALVDHSFVSWTHGPVATRVGPLLIAPWRESLCCCWDKELGEDDWEEAVASLGKHAIRVMDSFAINGTSFSNQLTARYGIFSEFRND